MAKKNKKNASRGSVNNIILESLYSGDKYGYEIISEVESKTDGKVVLKQPSLYSSLTRFEDKGYVTSYWADSEIGGKRHYYKLLDAGRKYFENNVLNKKSEFDWLDNDYTTKQEQIDEDVDSENIVDNTTTEEYMIDDNDTSDYSTNNFANYTFDVQDRMRTLLEGTDNEEILDEDEELISTQTIDNNSNIQLEDDENILDTNSIAKENSTEDAYVIDNSSPIIDDDLVETDEEELKEQALYNSINNIHQDYSTRQDDVANKDTIKYTNNLRKEMDNVYYSIKSGAKIETYDDEPDYIREQKKKASLEILYGGNKNEETKSSNKYQFVNSSPNYYNEAKSIKKNTSTITSQSINQAKVFTGYNTSDFEEILERNKATNNYRSNQNKTNQSSVNEISDKEREARNKEFVERFDMIADSKLVKTDGTYTEDLATMQSMTNQDEDILDIKSNYEDIDTEYQSKKEEEKFVDLDEEDSYYFPTKTKETAEETQEFNEQLNSSSITINKFDNIYNNNDSYNYIKINKAKFILGIVLLLLMVVEVSIMLTVFKTLDLMTKSDNIIFICAYVICFVVAFALMSPFIANPNKRKLSTFRCGFSVSMGILSFLVLSILSYAINTFIGLDFTNINDFYVKLFVPIVLSSNLIWAPMIYRIISKNKQLY